MERERHIQLIEQETPISRAEEFVSRLTQISTDEFKNNAVRRYDVENSLSDYLRRHHQGSAYLDDHLPHTIHHLLAARTNGHASHAIQEELGIKLPSTVEEMERDNDRRSSLGIKNAEESTVEEARTGVLSQDGAKKYELKHLVQLEPVHILAAIKRGEIKLAEDTLANHKRWQESFEDKNQEPFNSEANLLAVLRSPYEVTLWKRQMEQLGMS